MSVDGGWGEWPETEDLTLEPDDALAAVIGSKARASHEIIKVLMDYIARHRLLVRPHSVRADEKLEAVFDGRPQVTMFELVKCIRAHTREARSRASPA